MFQIFILVNVAYGLLSLGVLWWFWQAWQLRQRFRLIAFPVLSLVVLSFLLIYRTSSDSAIALALLPIGGVWTGCFLYVLLMIGLFEAGSRLVSRRKDLLPSLRLKKLQTRFVASLVILAVSTLIGLASAWNSFHPVLREVALTITVKPESIKTGEMGEKGETREASHLPLPKKMLTIAAISDSHLGRLRSATNLAETLALLRPHQPDAIFFLGDILDDHIRVETSPLAQILGELKPSLGAWGILGNHEYIAGNINTSLKLLDASGIKMLRDQWAVLGESFVVIGRDDRGAVRFTGAPRKALATIVDEIPEHYRHLPRFVLDHQPYKLEESERAGAALQLSGHTHNGQIWPVNHLVAKLYENAYGHSMRGNTHYFVSSGVGTWGPPIRNTSRSEIIIFKLNFVQSPVSVSTP